MDTKLLVRLIYFLSLVERTNPAHKGTAAFIASLHALALLMWALSSASESQSFGNVESFNISSAKSLIGLFPFLLFNR